MGLMKKRAGIGQELSKSFQMDGGHVNTFFFFQAYRDFQELIRSLLIL